MASEVISFPVNLRRNQNKYNAAYGKYYAEADTKDPLNLKGFVYTIGLAWIVSALFFQIGSLLI